MAQKDPPFLYFVLICTINPLLLPSWHSSCLTREWCSRVVALLLGWVAVAAVLLFCTTLSPLICNFSTLSLYKIGWLLFATCNFIGVFCKLYSCRCVAAHATLSLSQYICIALQIKNWLLLFCTTLSVSQYICKLYLFFAQLYRLSMQTLSLCVFLQISCFIVLCARVFATVALD